MGAVPGRSLGLETIVELASGVLSELGLEVGTVDLFSLKLPYFDGKPNPTADKVLDVVRESAGVLVASTVHAMGPSAVSQCLLEYLELPEAKEAFAAKNCMIVAVSRNGGERSCLDSITRALQSAGAYDSVRVGLQESEVKAIAASAEKRDIFEKQVEDFYRMVRQNRKFFIPADEPRPLPDLQSSINLAEKEVLRVIERRRKQPLDEIAKKLNLDDLDESQARDINEISKHFKKKFVEPKSDEAAAAAEAKLGEAPKLGSARQMTQAFVRRFQSHISAGLNAVLQLNISGAEPFTGYYRIQSIDCLYEDGAAENPDLTILSDSEVWKDILSGKYTAQKAFMIGRLKVRGNFVLLTKFDQLFSVGKQ
jgi:putative sterol carrier protein/NAD(P)H-dependent FMN reductase